jgi:hypothetical protein
VEHFLSWRERNHVLAAFHPISSRFFKFMPIRSTSGGGRGTEQNTISGARKEKWDNLPDWESLASGSFHQVTSRVCSEKLPSDLACPSIIHGFERIEKEHKKRGERPQLGVLRASPVLVSACSAVGSGNAQGESVCVRE